MLRESEADNPELLKSSLATTSVGTDWSSILGVVPAALAAISRDGLRVFAFLTVIWNTSLSTTFDELPADTLLNAPASENE